MVILFNELFDEENLEIVSKDRELQSIVDETLKMIFDRLHVLDEQITSEELHFQYKNPCIIVFLSNVSLMEDPLFSVNGYSENLTERILSSFSKKDFEGLHERIGRLLQAINN